VVNKNSFWLVAFINGKSESGILRYLGAPIFFRLNKVYSFTLANTNNIESYNHDVYVGISGKFKLD